MWKRHIAGGRLVRVASLLLGVLAVVLLGLPATASEGSFHPDVRAELHPGVTWEHLHDPGRLALDIAHVAPTAPVALQPVIADGKFLGPSRANAPTSSMCAAAGGVVCVNADFWLCPSCGIPFGGMVREGVPLRSATERHRQVTLLKHGRLVTEPLRLDLRLVATFEPEEPGVVEGAIGEPEPAREEVLPIDAVNRPRDGGVVLYSPVWWGTTRAPASAVEVSFTGAVPRIASAGPVESRGLSGPDSTIPGDGFVLVATGPARDGFERRLAEMNEADRLELHVGANMPAWMSIGGHPVLLRDGEVLPQDPADGKVVNRHPRTLLGWNDDGHRWVVTVDGRQPGHSVGVTLAEATELLRSLGATDAINLDGGGSSTFVTGVPCTDGRAPCIRNVPSDGRERSVSTALALVPTEGTVVSNAPTPPPPPPPTTTTTPPTTAPPTTAPPTTAPPPTTTSTAPPTTTTSTTVPASTTGPFTTRSPVRAVESGSPVAAAPVETSRSRRLPASTASVAIVVVAALTVRLRREGQRAASVDHQPW